MSPTQADRLRLIARGEAGFAPGAEPDRQARTLAIASGKGGVGKTNLAVNLGLALAKRGSAVALIDLDLGLANVDVILGSHPQRTLADVLAGHCTVEQALTPGPFGLQVLYGGSSMPELAHLAAAQRARLVESFAVLDRAYDVVLLDIGAGLSPAVLNFVVAAGDALVVTTTEPTAMTDAYALIKMASRQAPATTFSLVVNQVTDIREAEEVATTLINVASHFLGLHLTSLAYLPYDVKLPIAVKRQVPLLVAYPSCRLATTIEQLAARLQPAPASATRPGNSLGGFLHRLSRRATNDAHG